MEQSFLAAIEANPDQATPKLIYADWLDEQGRGSDADAMRWLAATRKSPFPYGDLGDSQWTWFADYFYEQEEVQKRMSLPRELFHLLDPIVSQKDRTIHVCYNSFQEAIGDFLDVWQIATAQPSWFWRLFRYKAWVPDYNGPLKVPEGIQSAKTKPPKGIQSGLKNYAGHDFDIHRTCKNCGLTELVIRNERLNCNYILIDGGDGYPTIL